MLRARTDLHGGAGPSQAVFFEQWFRSSFFEGLVELSCVRAAVLKLILEVSSVPGPCQKQCSRVRKTLSVDFLACLFLHLLRDPVGLERIFIDLGSNLGARWDPDGSLLMHLRDILFSKSGVVFGSRFRKGVCKAFVSLLIDFGYQFEGVRRAFLSI